MRFSNYSFAEYKDIYRKLVFPALLVLITCLFFIRCAGYEMYLNMDDGFYVIFNQNLDLTWSNIVYWFKNSCLGLYTPLQMVSYMFDHALWGDNVTGYHLQNIFWHILTVIVVYYIFMELEIDRRIAFFLVLVFAVHPQRIESVVWIAERKDVLSGFFYFACLLTWLKSYKNGRWFSPLACILMILGCLSKPLAVTIPAVIFCLLWHREHKFVLRTFALRLAPFLTISLGYFVLKSIYLANMIKDLSSPGKDWQKTLLMVLDNFRMYFMKTFLPSDLIPLYPYFEPSSSAVATIFLFYFLAVAGAIILLFKMKNIFIYDIIPMLLCFISALLPMCGLFNFSNADFADRYSYTSSVFLLCGAALLITRLINNNGIEAINKKIVFLPTPRLYLATAAGAVCYMLYIMSYTLFYMPCWKDNYTLYLTICDHKNANFRGVAVLAELEYSKGNYAAALALADTLKTMPWMTSFQQKAFELFQDYIRGMVLYNTSRQAEAMSYFSRILESPAMPGLKIIVHQSCREVINTAGNYYIQHGKLKQAARLYEMLPKLYPNEIADCYFYRGLAAFLDGNLAVAKIEFVNAQKIAPSDTRIAANLKRVEALMQEKQNDR